MKKTITILVLALIFFGCDKSKTNNNSIFGSNASFTKEYEVLYAISKVGKPNDFLERITLAKQNGMDNEMQNFYAISWLGQPSEFLKRMALAKQNGLDNVRIKQQIP